MLNHQEIINAGNNDNNKIIYNDIADYNDIYKNIYFLIANNNPLDEVGEAAAVAEEQITTQEESTNISSFTA